MLARAQVLFEDCQDCVFVINGAVKGGVVEIWDCTNCNMPLNTPVPTVQVAVIKSASQPLSNTSHAARWIVARV